jgi:hypothetical protein
MALPTQIFITPQFVCCSVLCRRQANGMARLLSSIQSACSGGAAQSGTGLLCRRGGLLYLAVLGEDIWDWEQSSMGCGMFGFGSVLAALHTSSPSSPFPLPLTYPSPYP